MKQRDISILEQVFENVPNFVLDFLQRYSIDVIIPYFWFRDGQTDQMQVEFIEWYDFCWGKEVISSHCGLEFSHDLKIYFGNCSERLSQSALAEFSKLKSLIFE